MKTLILAGIIAVSATAKDHNWQTGKMIDTQISTRYAGQTGGNGNTEPINIVWQTVVIAGDNYTYAAERTLRWRWTKPANLTVNAPIKFAVEKEKLFLVDDSGREYQLDIDKRIKGGLHFSVR
jgi:hypothetical protein